METDRIEELEDQLEETQIMLEASKNAFALLAGSTGAFIRPLLNTSAIPLAFWVDIAL